MNTDLINQVLKSLLESIENYDRLLSERSEFALKKNVRESKKVNKQLVDSKKQINHLVVNLNKLISEDKGHSREISREIKLVKDKIEKIKKQETEGKGKIEKTFHEKYQLSPRQIRRYMKELGIEKQQLKKFIKERGIKKSKEKPKIVKYSVYKTNFYAKLSNMFMENLSYKIGDSNPDFFKKLGKQLVLSNIDVLSRTYLSMILFTTVISLPIFFAILLFATMDPILAPVIAILATPIVFFSVYKYPSIKAGERAKKIKQEMIFAVVHMAAVAGSGAHPVRIFELLIKSKEYDELEVELKKVMNYINLFGYSLSNSMREVAETTPSPEFKELLHGMISTIETGGDIKDYLGEKAKDTLVTFRFDQKKHVEKIATYSDIYTGVLIAAPLLFVVTLAILEKIYPTIGGIAISTVAILGILVLLPALNIIFMLLLESGKKE